MIFGVAALIAGDGGGIEDVWLHVFRCYLFVIVDVALYCVVALFVYGVCLPVLFVPVVYVGIGL